MSGSSGFRVSRRMTQELLKNDVERAAKTVGSFSHEDCERYKDYPLLLSLVEYQDSRNSAMITEGQSQIYYPLSSDGWMNSVFIWKGRALDWIVVPWIIVMINCVLYIVLQEVVFEFPKRRVDSWEMFYGFVMNTTLSFLLVFRLNRAAGRFWLARELWGTLLARCRTMIGSVLMHGGHDTESQRHTLRWIVALGLLVKDFIRGTKELPRDIFQGILSDQEVDMVEKQGHCAIFACDTARFNLRRLFSVDESTPLPIAHSRIAIRESLESQLDIILDTCGGMERIKKTPLPIVYVSHLRTFLLGSLLLFPYIWGPTWGWGTIPIVAVASLALLGIEGTASEVECPFRINRVNALNMDAYCLTLLSNATQQIRNQADREILARVS